VGSSTETPETTYRLALLFTDRPVWQIADIQIRR